MSTLVVVAIVVAAVLVVVALSIRIVQQYERGVVFRFGRLLGERQPGIRFIIPVVDRLRHVSLRIVTMPIQSQGIITRDNVSVGVAAVAYFRVVDATKSVVAIEDVSSAIDQIAQTTLRRSSASTRSTRPSPRRTGSTTTSARSSTRPRPSGVWT